VKGFLLQARSGHFLVLGEDGKEYRASARKKTLAGSRKLNPLVPGDEVEFALSGDAAVVEKSLPRKTLIERGSDHHRSGRTE